MLAWRRRKLEHIHCPETAETLAIVQGIEFATDRGWQHIVIESDCLTVINAVKSSVRCLTMAGHFIDFIKSKVGSFSNVVFLHIKPSGNVVAHRLAHGIVCNMMVLLCYLSLKTDCCNLFSFIYMNK